MLPELAIRNKGSLAFSKQNDRCGSDLERHNDRLGASRTWAGRGRKQQMTKRSIALALCCCLICSPAAAKTFVAVLWPMFGPIAAPGLVELVAELKELPNVEVATYLHQSWPSLVEDINHQPQGTRIVVVGYSLGANATVFVANNANYVDSIIALQPSMFSWNPSVTGKVGRLIEIYNPNPVMTFGGMGSKKLVGENIEYIANNDSHPGAQYNAEFRSLVKSEIARLSTEAELDSAGAEPRGLDPSDQLQPDQASIEADKQNLIRMIGEESAKDDSGCNGAVSESGRNKTPDELTQKILDTLCANQH
jgi:hypothetical protein